MQSHEIDYKIIGHDMQMVEITLDPGESVVAEAGAMTYMGSGIEYESKLGDGSDPDQGFFGKVFGAGKRMITGESLFMTHFSNGGPAASAVCFSAPFPGAVVPIDLSQENGKVTCQKDSFLVAALGTQIDIAFSKRIGAGLFGGEGFVLQSLSGDGKAFMHAGGTVQKKELNNETLRLDTGCLVGFSGDIDYDIELAGGLKSMAFGGEGMCLATLSGSGSVWIQSLPFSRLADRILAHMPKAGGSKQGES
jgi:uncharacterized protein (TIGR00266 family)